MTWNSRVSFVLTDTLALKKIKLLDVVLENSSPADGADDSFDADVAIATGELQHLLPDLIDALGGQKEAAVSGVTGAPVEAEAAPWEGVAA
jgi:recombination associated protein RdgC